MFIYSSLLLILCFAQISKGTKEGYGSTHALTKPKIPDVVKALYDCLSQLVAAKNSDSVSCEYLSEQGSGSGHAYGSKLSSFGNEDELAHDCLSILSLPALLDFACFDYVVKVEEGLASPCMDGSVLLTFNSTCASWGEPITAQLRVYKWEITRESGGSCADFDTSATVSLFVEGSEGHYHMWQSFRFSREELLEGNWIVFSNLETNCMQEADRYHMKILIEDNCAELNSSSFGSEAFLIAVLPSPGSTSPTQLYETNITKTDSSSSAKRSAILFKPWDYCKLYPLYVR